MFYCFYALWLSRAMPGIENHPPPVAACVDVDITRSFLCVDISFLALVQVSKVETQIADPLRGTLFPASMSSFLLLERGPTIFAISLFN